jgi:hypothetical protein
VGAAGAEGDAYTFITPEQDKYAGDIMRALQASEVPVPEDLQKMADGPCSLCARRRPSRAHTGAGTCGGRRCSEFKKKVEAGEAKYHGSGFAGRGLSAIEMAHAYVKQTQRLVRSLLTLSHPYTDTIVTPPPRQTFGGAAGEAPEEEDDEEEVVQDGELVGTRRKLTFSAIVRTSATVAAEKAAAATAAAKAATAAAVARMRDAGPAPPIVVVKSWADGTGAADSRTAAAPAVAVAAAPEPALKAPPSNLAGPEATAWRAAQERAAALNQALRKAGSLAPAAPTPVAVMPPAPVVVPNLPLQLPHVPIMGTAAGGPLRFVLPPPPAPGTTPGGLAAKASESSSKSREAEVAEFWAEIEINDFPQTARWRVTNKVRRGVVVGRPCAGVGPRLTAGGMGWRWQETMTQLADFAKVAITTKGNFVPGGAKPKDGERKLYLLIEATTQQPVDKAVAEIKRLLTEATASALERGTDRPVGRYSVV